MHTNLGAVMQCGHAQILVHQPRCGHARSCTVRLCTVVHTNLGAVMRGAVMRIGGYDYSIYLCGTIINVMRIHAQRP